MHLFTKLFLLFLDDQPLVLIESPESPLYMSFLVQDIPKAESLLQRLKPKPVADPFLDKEGKILSLEEVLK